MPECERCGEHLEAVGGGLKAMLRLASYDGYRVQPLWRVALF